MGGDLRPKGAKEYEDLRDKPRKARKSHGSKCSQDHHPHVPGHDRPDPAETFDFPVMGPVVDNADK